MILGKVLKIPRWLWIALALGLAALLLMLPAAQAHADEGQIVVELQGASYRVTHPFLDIGGTDNTTRQVYKFKQERRGSDFHYILENLSNVSYNVEFSFIETQYSGAWQRRFSVYGNGSPLPGLAYVDIFSAVGKNNAYQVTVNGVTTPGGRMDLRFVSTSGEATVSNIRLISAGETALEIQVVESRNWQSLPLRFINGTEQDVHEVILGRLGSRFMINPVPQLLAWRQSPYGTWAGDLSELVLAFREYPGGPVRCLPFTDRYEIFTSIDQELALTGVSYECRDPALPFTATVTLKAPFYPQDSKLSTAPFFYVDVRVTNQGDSPTGGQFLLVRAHKDDNTGISAPQALGGASAGYKFNSRYTYGEESHVLDSSHAGYVDFQEAVAVDNTTGLTWHYNDITATSWIWGSPAGFPPPYRHEVYTFEPRGYSGLDWSFSLAGSGSDSITLALACHSGGSVLSVRGNPSYLFLYNKPSGPNLASVEDVVDYALGAERASIEEKSSFFDGILSQSYLSSFPQAGHDLAAYALQSFICNTWWCYESGGQEWFSVWEGTPCMFHSTIDVEYNDAWFYLSFWPDLLRKLLQEWPLFEKVNAQGKYLSHDMGMLATVNGMVYPHDMPVEENVDYILLIYSYWKYTGDGAFAASAFGHVKDYASFVSASDTDGDGLPDINVSNTIDQGSPAIQDSRNQTYLGVKALAAYQAAKEMAQKQSSPDQEFITACEERIRIINITLGSKLWLGDHFAVCGDQSVPSADRQAYSIYASNGLLYLLSSGLDCGLTGSNLERMCTDLATAATATSRRYGYVHTSENNENQWVSQNLWRDALGYWLGADNWAQGQAQRLEDYWNLQRYYASKKNGGFWDVCVYKDQYFMGTSEAAGLGLGDSASAASYLSESNLDGGGIWGAYSLDSAFQQSLGYYPRGTAVFSLVNAMGRLRLDRSEDFLLYDTAVKPGRVPVYSCADWGAPDPAQRIPVLVFDQDGNLQQTINAPLLPGYLSRGEYSPITGLEARPFSCSPGTASPRQEVTVSYSALAGSISGAAVFMGNNQIRTLNAGASSLTWNGTNDSGQPVSDGVYDIYLETHSTNPALFTPPDSIEAGVNTNLPSPSTTWFLAEGFTGNNATGGEFDTWVLVQNPNGQQAEVQVTFMQPGGINTRQDYVLPPDSRFTIHVDDILPAAEVSTKVEANLPVVAERAVYFNGGLAGHDSIGVNSPSSNWYLAEGYTGGNFDEWVLIQNPSEAPAAINVRFQTQDQGERSEDYLVEPYSRFTIHVDDIFPDAQLSTFITSSQPVVVERAQYLNFMRSGTCSIGARNASHTWYFAEGYTEGNFEEWLLIQNPQDGPARVELTFMQPNGINSGLEFTVAPRSRYTVAVDNYLSSAEVSSRISSNVPVVAERAMYWNDRSDGHDTLGTPCPEYEWFFAEGYTGGGFEEWFLVQNPWGEQAEVEVFFLFPGGSTQSTTITVPARSRYTIDVGAMVGAKEVSLRISSNLPVVAERAMYFHGRSGGTSSIGAMR